MSPAVPPLATASSAARPPAPPLTHHQILALVAPYTQAGYQVDLAASQRAERRLAFKPVIRPAEAPGQVALTEWLSLEVYASGSGQLTRTLVHPSGLRAAVQASGQDPAALLAKVAWVASHTLFQQGPGYTLARSYAVPAGAAAPVFTLGEVQLNGLNLSLSVPALRGVSADLQLRAQGEALALPQDLLAVLGWSWARLITTPLGWRSKLRLRGSPARRTARAEQALELAARHLAQVLTEPPARFHERHRRARLGVWFRRAIPLLTPLLLVATIVLMPRVDTSPHPGLWLMLYHVPTMLVVLSFCLQELPALEVPPWPRRLSTTDWRAAPPEPASGGQGAGAAGRPGAGHSTRNSAPGGPG